MGEPSDGTDVSRRGRTRVGRKRRAQGLTTRENPLLLLLILFCADIVMMFWFIATISSLV